MVDAGFWMPSRNIVCNAGRIVDKAGKPAGGRALACVVYSESDRRGNRTWYLHETGHPGVAFVMADPATEGENVLRYGHSWSWHGFRCTSRPSGLSCRNRSGHGFLLSRESQRLF